MSSFNAIDSLCGARFGRLTVLSLVEHSSRSKHKRYLCQCDCGKLKEIWRESLKRSGTDSCGCFTSEKLRRSRTKHGMAASRIYKLWAAMKDRCHNSRNSHYRSYGGRGITVCPSWRNSFAAFYADMGDCPIGHSIDRIDNNGNYEPGNCRWALKTLQQRNRRCNRLIEFKGRTQTIAGWCEELRLNHQTVTGRIARGWAPEAAITTPVLIKYRNGRVKNVEFQ